MMGSIPRLNAKGMKISQSHWEKMKRKISMKVKDILIDQGWFFIIAGFLLGRAIILSAVSPFAIAFVATIWLTHRNQALKSLLAIVVVALSFSMMHGMFITLSLTVFMFLIGFFKHVDKHRVLIPLFAFFATVAPRLFLYSIMGQLRSEEHTSELQSRFDLVCRL